MPLVRIDLASGKPESYRRAITQTVYDAMTLTLKVPADDRFMLVTEHPAENMDIDPTYLGINRTADCVVIQVTLNAGRTVEVKKAFYRAVAEGLQARIGLRTEDVLINLVEVVKENWSFGRGEAPYA